MKIEVDKELLIECFALLGVARFDADGLDSKRQDTRNKLIELIKPKK
jgi:hypothetical protein